MYLDYQTIIVGAGMSGLGAAYRLIKSGHRDFAILESQPTVGGHLITIDVDGPKESNTIDIGVQFGFYNKENLLLKLIKDEDLDVDVIQTYISYNGSNSRNKIMYSSLGNENIELEIQINRWTRLINKEPPFWWYLINFGSWCKHYKFTDDFIDFCIKPMMSLLMLMRDIKRQNAMFVISVSKPLVHNNNPNYNSIWTCYGGIGMLPQAIVKKFNLESKIQLNQKVTIISKKKTHYEIIVKNTQNGTIRTLKCRNIVTSVSAPVVRDIVDSGCITKIQKKFIEYCCSFYSPFITILHRDRSVIPNPEIYYNYEQLPENKWRSHGNLDIGYYLSASQWLDTLEHIKGPKRVISWNYPMTSWINVMYLQFIKYMNLNKNKTFQMAGAWTNKPGMEYAFSSGIDAVNSLDIQ